MSFKSAAGEEFLSTVEEWLRSQPEVSILIQYSRAAGNKDFEFYTSFATLQERLRQLPAETCVTVFRDLQLPLRGIVDDEFIRKCLNIIPDGSEYAVVDTVPTKMGQFSFFDFSAGVSHDELRGSLESSRGKPVAVGEYPPWLEDSPDVTSGYVPAEDGKLGEASTETCSTPGKQGSRQCEVLLHTEYARNRELTKKSLTCHTQCR